MKAFEFNTPLGKILALGDHEALYSLEFEPYERIYPLEEREPLLQIKEELDAYFQGTLNEFKTPIRLVGTDFQKRVWKELQKIPRGDTCSYSELAFAVDKPSGRRAVAQANRTNPLPIIIPCHRVILANGDLGGYNGGIERKKWLLQHEKS